MDMNNNKFGSDEAESRTTLNILHLICCFVYTELFSFRVNDISLLYCWTRETNKCIYDG